MKYRREPYNESKFQPIQFDCRLKFRLSECTQNAEADCNLPYGVANIFDIFERKSSTILYYIPEMCAKNILKSAKNYISFYNI